MLSVITANNSILFIELLAVITLVLLYTYIFSLLRYSHSNESLSYHIIVYNNDIVNIINLLIFTIMQLGYTPAWLVSIVLMIHLIIVPGSCIQFLELQ